MSADHGFDTVEPALLRTQRSGAEGLDHALDVVAVHFARKGAMQGFAHR